MQPLTQPLHVQTDSNGYEPIDPNNTVTIPTVPTGVSHAATVIITQSSPPSSPPSPIDGRVVLKSGSLGRLTVQKIKERAQKTAEFQKKYAKFLEVMRSISDKLGQSTLSATLEAMKKKDQLQIEAQGKEKPEIDFSSLGDLGATLKSIDENRRHLDKSNAFINFIEECSNINVEHLTSLASQLTIMWEGRRNYNLVLFSMKPYYQFGINYRLDELAEIHAKVDVLTPQVTEQAKQAEFESLIDKLASLVRMKEELTCLDYALANKLITKEFLIAAYKERIKAKHYETFQCIEKELDSSQTLAAANESTSTEERIVAERIIRRVKEVRNLFARLDLASTEIPDVVEVLSEMEVSYPFKLSWDANLDLLCKIVELKERLWARSTLKLSIDETDREKFPKLIEEATTSGEHLEALQKEITQLINEERNGFKAIKDPHIEIQAIWDKIFKLEQSAKAPEQQPAEKKTWFGFFSF